MGLWTESSNRQSHTVDRVSKPCHIADAARGLLQQQGASEIEDLTH
jgi:hypothetical protein